MKITIFSEELRECLNAAGLSDCGENDTWNYWYQRLMNAYNESVERQIMTEQVENAKLRELAVLQSVISKHMSTCPTTDCQVCPVNDECAESVHLEGLLGIDDKETSWLVQWRSEDAADVRAENAKLRELCADLYAEMITYSDAPHYNASVWAPKLRELGIEVEL